MGSQGVDWRVAPHAHASILDSLKTPPDYQVVTNLPLNAPLSVSPNSSSRLVIATRESRLALWQAEHVMLLLKARGFDASLLGMTTRGDQILDRSLSKVGGKGLFVKELEVALEEARADLAVHSLKDVPMDLPAGFSLACVMRREDPRDALVSNRYTHLSQLPLGSVIGTSSLRRTVLLRDLRPDLKIEPLRGNLDTRLRKLDDGHYAAIVLAAAGLKRLGLAQRIAQFFEPQEMLPAAGQGALGIEIRSDRQDVMDALRPLADQETWLAVTAERAVSRTMGGSCSMPLAAHAVWAVDQATGLTTSHLHIAAAWGESDGQPGSDAVLSLIRASATAPVSTMQQANELGEAVARQLINAGAKAVQAPVGSVDHGEAD